MVDREHAQKQNQQKVPQDRTQFKKDKEELTFGAAPQELKQYQIALEHSNQKLKQEREERERLLSQLSIARANLKNLEAKFEQRLEEKIKQKKLELDLYQNLAQQISYVLSYESLFRTMLKHIHNIVPCDVTGGVLIQDKHCELFLNPKRLLTNSAQIEIQKILLSSVVKIEDLDIINQPLCLHNFNYQYPQPLDSIITQINSYVLVPLIADPEKKKQTLGFLFVGTENNYQFSEDDNNILNTLANQVSVYLKQLQRLIKAEKSQLENEKIRQALAREKELNELKSRIVRTISHEYRTPLTVISLATDLLENQNKKLNEQQRQVCFTQIHDAIKHMANLVEDALVVNQAESAEIEFNPTQVDVVQLCEQIINDFQLIAAQKHRINLIDKNCDRQVYLDKKLLKQILSNLLSNAVKYSPQETTVILECICHHQKIQFRVSDRGIGVPAEEQNRIFERFHRGTNVGTLPGTGLGLAIVKKCVDIYRGEISFQSQVNVGTTVTVQLPLGKQS